jgi:hypothetical protein
MQLIGIISLPNQKQLINFKKDLYKYNLLVSWIF